VLLDLMESDKFHQMHFAVRRTIGADHPSLPGHFPGKPIVPGVVILDEILATLTEWREGSHIIVISAVKFLAPLKPDQPFVICLDSSGNAESQIAFCCQVEDRVIVEGRLHIEYGSD
jgi:3-hydroxymyristoyl/3-hydroxydecanoyl-(acyl carrier protein) dehydratase